MRHAKKIDLPTDQVRRYLEPGPVVLLSSAWKGRRNVMTMGWHTVMEFAPSLLGCVIAAGNHSFQMIRRSGECVINVPAADLLDRVVGVGNCSGAEVDKFSRFGLTADPAEQVGAPLIRECFANFECRVVDAKLVPRYNFFVLQVLKAHVAVSPRQPVTAHYQGEGRFQLSGKTVSRRGKFRAQLL